MTRLRVLGPRTALNGVLAAAQDVGRLHIVPPSPRAGLALLAPPAREVRRRRQIARRLHDADDALKLLSISASTPPRLRPPLVEALRTAARAARAARAFAEREAALRDEWDPLESTCRHASLSIL